LVVTSPMFDEHSFDFQILVSENIEATFPVAAVVVPVIFIFLIIVVFLIVKFFKRRTRIGKIIF